MQLDCSITALDIVGEVKPGTVFFMHNDTKLESSADNINITNVTEDFLFTATLTIPESNIRTSGGTYDCVYTTVNNQKKRSRDPVHVKVLPIIHCQWSKWEDASGCSRTCGESWKARVRRVLVPAANGGKTCGENNTQTVDCNVPDCPGNNDSYFPP